MDHNDSKGGILKLFNFTWGLALCALDSMLLCSTLLSLSSLSVGMKLCWDREFIFKFDKN